MTTTSRPWLVSAEIAVRVASRSSLNVAAGFSVVDGRNTETQRSLYWSCRQVMILS
jgi:hypothetical protein